MKYHKNAKTNLHLLSVSTPSDSYKALAAYQHAIRLDPNYAHAHRGLGEAYLALGDHDKAIAAYLHKLLPLIQR